MKTSAREETPYFYVGIVRGNVCFYSCGYYVGCSQISRAEIFRELRSRWYGLRSFTGLLTKIWGSQKKLFISIEYFVEWLSNQIPPWIAYRSLISGRLIALDKLPGVLQVRVGETWRLFFSKCVLKVTGPEATHTCKYDQLVVGLKAGIDRAVHRVKYI